jgi:hypothetical protein
MCDDCSSINIFYDYHCNWHKKNFKEVLSEAKYPKFVCLSPPQGASLQILMKRVLELFKNFFKAIDFLVLFDQAKRTEEKRIDTN